MEALPNLAQLCDETPVLAPFITAFDIQPSLLLGETEEKLECFAFSLYLVGRERGEDELEV